MQSLNDKRIEKQEGKMINVKNEQAKVGQWRTTSNEMTRKKGKRKERKKNENNGSRAGQAVPIVCRLSAYQ